MENGPFVRLIDLRLQRVQTIRQPETNVSYYISPRCSSTGSCCVDGRVTNAIAKGRVTLTDSSNRCPSLH